MGWHQELLIGFDLETTGMDPREARSVTRAAIEVRAGQELGRREWPADPGVELPADAVAVHGIGNERAAAEVRAAGQGADALTGHWKTGVPVAACNGASCPLTSITSQMSHPATMSGALR